MTSNLPADALTGKPTPPSGLFPRLRFYGRRNGYAYAALSYLGRRSPTFWRLVGPLFTRWKIREWLQTPGRHVLNLGGGSNLFDRWLTADIDPRADIYVNITTPLPFDNETIDVVYLEEVIEHVSYEKAASLSRECFRILKAGGTLRLTTPDLDSFVSHFDGSVKCEKAINSIFYNHGHKYIYCRSGIIDLLKLSGFNPIRRSSFGDERSEFGEFDTHAFRFDASDIQLTQYLEAKKH